MNSPFRLNNLHRLPSAAVSVFALMVWTAEPAGATVNAVPGQLVVSYEHGTSSARQDSIAAASGVTPSEQVSPTAQVVKLKPGQSVANAISRLKASGDVAHAVPNVIAHMAGASTWQPNDIGRTGRAAGGWLNSQWNFSSNSGVGAMPAWGNLLAVGRPGGSGVKIAVVDSGVAFTNWGKFQRSPDFTTTIFSDPYDFIARNRFPLDRNGHGTHVTGTIAESTNNGIFMTGLAWGATIMPLRVLDALGNGDSATIARAIRYAADHRADVINLSIEFDTRTNGRDIPEVISAVRYANSKGSLVVAAAGNDSTESVAYPARAANVLAVGASTEHRCLSDFSNFGTGLDIVAPGGGIDREIADDPSCRPTDTPGRDIVQLGLKQSSRGSALVPYQFELDAEDGTSMAAPHVSATAALVIASGILGPRPTPAAISARLMATADAKGSARYYGAGLLNAARATAPLG